MDNSSEEQARVLLFLLVQRHWKMNGPSLMLAMHSLGPAVEGKLVVQVRVEEGVCTGVGRCEVCEQG